MSIYTPPALTAVDFALEAFTPADMTPAEVALSAYSVPSLNAVDFALSAYTPQSIPYAGWELLPGAGSVTATLAWTEDSDVFAVAGSVRVSAALAWTEANDTFAASGAVQVTSALAWTEDDDVTAITGSVTSASITADLAWVEDDDVFALSGSVAASADEKIGGDDAFHHGWDREAWKRRKSREDAIVRTIEETYQRLMGIAPAPAVVAKVRAETPKELRDYTKELEFTQWLSDQIAAELDDEEAILLLI